MNARIAGLVLTLVAWSPLAQTQPNPPEPARGFDLSQEKVLYAIGYAHLDTQWRWDYVTTIRHYLPATLLDNFALFEKYPNYVFNFTGSFRYQLMQEYYPEEFERLKEYVAQGRWKVVGSSVDEGDVNVPSTESLVRQILYGNRYFKSMFGAEPVDFMLPDCFGFPASLPSVFAHCGLKGFVTQKLTWGSAVGVPFNVGVWEGPDGEQIVAALNPGPYVNRVRRNMSTHPGWIERIEDLGRDAGVFTDYYFYGTGDRGGAPDEESVQWIEKAAKSDGPIRVAPTSSDQLFRDLTPEQVERLPRYKGDLLLTEHSAGTLTSQAYMKRWNRKNELLADAAERASVAADWLGGATYPHEKLEAAWIRVLASQMHDILPGTSIPKAYEYSWNDEVLALNGFAEVLENGVGGAARALDTRRLPRTENSQSIPLVVYNPLSIEREDVVEAEVVLPDGSPRSIEVLDPEGTPIASQILESRGQTRRIAFLAKVPPVGMAVFQVTASTRGWPGSATNVSESHLENDRFRVEIDENGDIAQIHDKAADRKLLSAPAGLVFLRDAPAQYPAWNMDWKDLKEEPFARVAGPARVRVTERGPARVAVEVIREAEGSRFTQTIRLANGAASDRVEVVNQVEWYTLGACLKADFPLTVSNPLATYNWGLGTIERNTNHPKKYEVPSHQWFDLTAEDGSYGVTILEDCKFGSDKPAADRLRLTLLRTPVCSSYADQATQDHGRHEFTYAITGHEGDWRAGEVTWKAARLNQPLRAFRSTPHPGVLGRRTSLVQVSSPQVALQALKRAEEGDEVIVRLQELHGRAAPNVHVRFAGGVTSVRQVDGQERPVDRPQEVPRIEDGALVCSLGPSRLQAYAVRLAPSLTGMQPPRSEPIDLAFDCDVVSQNSKPSDGDIDGTGRSLPAEQLPKQLVLEDLRFTLGPSKDGQNNAVACKGQTIAIKARSGSSLYLIAAASEKAEAAFQIDGTSFRRTVPSWTGYVGQWDNRIWDGQRVVGVQPGFIDHTPVAWYCSHRHLATEGDDPYQFSYLFKLHFELPQGATELRLPNDPRIKVMAASVARNRNEATTSALPLYDTLDGPLPVSRPGLVRDRALAGTGKFLDQVIIELACPTEDAEIRYTLDGSVPDANAKLCDAPIAIIRALTLKARAYKAGLPPSLLLEQSFTPVTARPARTVPNAIPGVRFEYYELPGLSRLPDFRPLRPTKTGHVKQIDISVRERDEDFAFRFLALVKVPERGLYVFGSSSDDGSRIWLNDELIVDHDGLHGSSERQGSVALEAGFHALRVEYFERGGDEALEVTLQGPGLERGPIPTSLLYRQEF